MPAADPQPESQEEILLAAQAALTDAPPAEDDYTRWPDPENAPHDELADLTDAELADVLAGPPSAAARLSGWPLTYLTPAGSLRPGAAGGGGGWPWPAGFEPRDGTGGGCGFADGGALARWTCWPPGWRWPGSPTTRMPAGTGWMMIPRSGCCGRSAG